MSWSRCVLVVVLPSRWRVKTTTRLIEKTRTLVVSHYQQRRQWDLLVRSFILFFHNISFGCALEALWLLADASFFISWHWGRDVCFCLEIFLLPDEHLELRFLAFIQVAELKQTVRWGVTEVDHSYRRGNIHFRINSSYTVIYVCEICSYLRNQQIHHMYGCDADVWRPELLFMLNVPKHLYCWKFFPALSVDCRDNRGEGPSCCPCVGVCKELRLVFIDVYRSLNL